MDVFTLTFYACVCAVLSYLAPSLRTPGRRLIIGALVGVAAAASLPVVRGTLGM